MFYPGGTYLRSGPSFFWDTGTYARSGSTLYRRDGTLTAFPVTLTVDVGTAGKLVVEVGSDYAEPSLILEDFIVSSSVVSSGIITDSDLLPTSIRLIVNSGRPNENVLLNVAMDGTYSCSLSGATQPGEFTLETSAATVDVRVKTGYDPRTVRDALQRALDAL